MQAATAAIDAQQMPADNGTSFAYKLARHLFRLPARMLGRMRQFDDLLEQPYSNGDTQGGANTDGRVARAQQRMRETGLAPLPGPWGFLTSGYFIGLFFMVRTLRASGIVSLTVHRPFSLTECRTSLCLLGIHRTTDGYGQSNVDSAGVSGQGCYALSSRSISRQPDPAWCSEHHPFTSFSRA